MSKEVSHCVLFCLYQNDCPQLLDRMLDSLCKQTVAPGEVVAVLNGPISEISRNVIESYAGVLSLTYVCLDENVGLANGLNAGLPHCHSTYVIRIDPDDECLPDRIEQQLRFILMNPNLSAASGQIRETNRQGKIVGERIVPTSLQSIKKFAKFRSPLNHPATILKTKDIIRVGGYPQFEKAQDYALWAVMLSQGLELGNQQDFLVNMTVDQVNFSKRGAQHLSHELKLAKFLYEIGHLNKIQFYIFVILRTILRLSPGRLKSFFYGLR